MPALFPENTSHANKFPAALTFLLGVVAHRLVHVVAASEGEKRKGHHLRAVHLWRQRRGGRRHEGKEEGEEVQLLGRQQASASHGNPLPMPRDVRPSQATRSALNLNLLRSLRLRLSPPARSPACGP